MCDFGPLRNWYLALGGAIAAAMSLVIFAIAWMNTGWLAFIATIGFWAAVGLSVVALGLVAGFRNALDTFCNCTRNIPFCAVNCSSARAILYAIIASLVVLAACSAIAANGEFGVIVLGIVLAIFVLTILQVILSAVMIALSNCQPAPVPAPPPAPVPPPPGSPIVPTPPTSPTPPVSPI